MTVSQTTVSLTTVSQMTVSLMTVSQTTVSQTTVSQTTVSQMTVSLMTVGASQKIHSQSLVDHPERYDFHHDFVIVVMQIQMIMPFSGGGCPYLAWLQQL